MTKRCAIALRMARIVAVLPTLTLAACDPIVTIAGANFPSWVLCMIAGAIIAALVRPLLVLSRLESHLGPLTIFYPSLIAMFAMIVWIIFFNRV
jgi:YtcA family